MTRPSAAWGSRVGWVADVLAWVMLAAVLDLLAVLAIDAPRTNGRGPGVLIAADLSSPVKPLITCSIQRYAANGGAEGRAARNADDRNIGVRESRFCFQHRTVPSIGAPRATIHLTGRAHRAHRAVAILVLMPIFRACGPGARRPMHLGTGLGALLLILVVAIVGKSLAARPPRYGGQSWRTSLAVGSLMNARAMELIAIVDLDSA